MTINRAFMGSKIQSAADFARLTREAINKANRIKASLKARSTFERPSETLLAFDGISNEICSIMDAAEAARNCHTDETFVKVADESYRQLFDYFSSLNTGDQS